MYLTKEVKEEIFKNTGNPNQTPVLQKDKLLCFLTESTTCLIT